MTTHKYSKPASNSQSDLGSSNTILGGLLLLAILAICILFSKLGETNVKVKELEMISGAFSDNQESL